MAIQVFHAIRPTFGGRVGWPPESVAAFGEFGDSEIPRPEGFAHVATVDVPDERYTEVFRLTNSIDCGWWENKGVTAHTEASTFREFKGIKGTRSTSVGDLILLSDGRILLCVRFGWDDITEDATEFWLDEVADHIRSEVAVATAAS